MKDWLIYYLQANIGLVLFYLAYQLGLKRNRHYNYLRVFLLSSLLLALIMPLFSNFSKGSTTVIEFDLQEVLIYQLDGNVIGVNEYSIASLLTITYLVGVALASALFLYRLIGVIGIVTVGEKFLRNGYTLIRSKRDVAVFSFFKFLVVGNSSPEPEREIILHEKAHINQRHTLDILLVELLKIVFWFNPVVYLYRNALNELHEYLADKAVLDQTEQPTEYINLILGKALGVEPHVLTNTFFNANALTKRIKAIHAGAGKVASFAWYNWLIIIAVGGIALQTSLALAAPNWVSKSKDVYTQVDIMPQYPGGFNELISFMNTRIKYPQQLLESNTQGTVYVKFIVNENGSIDKIKLLKGVHPQLDDVAISAVASMPNWTPGKQDGRNVPVSLTLPIQFAL